MARKKIPIRAWIATMIFLTTYVNYCVRSIMSVSIVSMVAHKKGQRIADCIKKEMDATRKETGEEGSNSTETTTEHILPNYGPRYDWDENVQGLILGTYFWGYVIGSLPGGAIAERWGPWTVVFWTHAISIVVNSCCVFAAWFHFGLLMFCRLIAGLMGGLVYPALQCMIGRWAPPAEKGKFVACLMGSAVGTCITWPLVGQVTQSFGWDWGFHVVSLEVALFCLVFYFVGANSPDEHRWISEEEKEFIKQAQGGNVTKGNKAIPPYRALLRSCPFWMLAILQFGNLWGLFLQLTNAPKYIAEVIGYDLRDAGSLAALAQIGRLVLGLTFGTIGDSLKKKGVSSRFIRKFFIIFSHFIPGLLLIGIGLSGCNTILVVTFLTLSLGSNGAAVITNLQNPQDLAPNFAGTIYGIISFTGGTTGFIVPTITGALTSKGSTSENWRFVWFIGGAVYICTGIIFILFGSTEVQPWNQRKEEAAA